PLHIVRVVNDVRVRFARRHVHAIGVAVTGEQLDHAVQGVVRGPDVELRLRLRRLILSGSLNSHASDFGYDLTLCTSLIPIEELTPGAEMSDEGGGDLRNTIYRAVTRSNRRMTAARRLLYRIAVPLGVG